MNLPIYFLINLVSVCIIYLYWSWAKYQNMCADFRRKLQIGSRVKFLHNKKPRFGRVIRIYTDAIWIKDEQPGGKLYVSNINVVFPRLGAKNRNPLKSKKS